MVQNEGEKTKRLAPLTQLLRLGSGNLALAGLTFITLYHFSNFSNTLSPIVSLRDSANLPVAFYGDLQH